MQNCWKCFDWYKNPRNWPKIGQFRTPDSQSGVQNQRKLRINKFETILDIIISHQFTLVTHKTFKHEIEKFQQIHFDNCKLDHRRDLMEFKDEL